MGGITPSMILDPQAMAGLRDFAAGANTPQGQGCTAAVSAYTRMRKGQLEQVRAYQRTNPDCAAGDTVGVIRIADNEQDRRRRSQQLLNDPNARFNRRAVPNLTERFNPRNPPVLSPMPPVAGGRGNTGGRQAANTVPGRLVPGSGTGPTESIMNIIMQEGRPIGNVFGDSRPNIRTLPGGEDAAWSMFCRLTNGREAKDVTPPAYQGQMFLMPDGTRVGI